MTDAEDAYDAYTDAQTRMDIILHRYADGVENADQDDLDLVDNAIYDVEDALTALHSLRDTIDEQNHD